MDDPFFIVGCGRSGTSLLRSWLNTHNEIAIPLESLFLVDYLRASDRMPVETLKRFLVNEPEIREWGISPVASDLEPSRTIAEAITNLHELYVAAHGKKFWGQKTPRFVRHLPVLLKHFPKARFVHVVRDPRAVVNSLMKSEVHRSSAFHASRRWREDVALGLAFERSWPDKTLRLSYEAFVSNPQAVLKEVADFLGIPAAWNVREQQARGSEEYSGFYKSIHANLDLPPSTERIEAWKRSMSEGEIRTTEAICGDLMEELGYVALNHHPVLDPSTVRRMKLQRLIRMPGQAAHYLRFRPRYLTHLLWRKWKLGLLKEFVWTVNY